MKPSAFLIAGLIAGAALRLLWPEPDASASAIGETSGKTTGAASARRNAKARIGSKAPDTPAEKAREQIRGKPRELGLSPKEHDAAPEPSWLYVGPPEATLLKSEEYVEASIVLGEYAVDDQCAPLFAQLTLTPENEARLRRTLAEMVFARHEISALAEVDPKSKSVERVREMVAASDEDYRQRLREQLGAQDFARFEAYFETLQERHALRDGFRRVAMLAEPLTPAQRDALVAARHAAKNGGNPPIAIAAVLTPAQQAAFAEWEVDQLALGALGKLTKRNWNYRQGRIEAIYGEPWEPERLR